MLPATAISQTPSPYIQDCKDPWVLIWSDEFDGDNLNWNDWKTENPDKLKHDTYRGKENVKVSDGELKLYITKESRNGSTWCAASVYLAKPLPRDTYVECRFRSAQCTGVNNAFWLASRTNPGTSYNNRYEIDIVEAKLDEKSGIGKAHLAWHDWKTSGYAVNDKGRKCDIAQGISVEHGFDEYHTWGLWYGENDIVYYLDGKAVWTGKTHYKYKHQWNTGTGKAPEWNPEEEKRAYGKHGQDDWSYRGGYNGDMMNVLLSTLPWDSPSSPLTDQADSSYMAIDYVRIFKQERMLDSKPMQLEEKPEMEITLDSLSDLSKDSRHYYSFVCSFGKGETDFTFVDNDGIKICSAKINPGKELAVSINSDSGSTASAYPAYEKICPEMNKGNEYLVIIRLTSSSFGKDAASMKIFDSEDLSAGTEPYFYPNIDSSGNTSVTNEWDINVKSSSDSRIERIRISGNCRVKEFRYGKHYSEILPHNL